MEKKYNLIEELGEETLAVKELEGRVYFETMPLSTVPSIGWGIPPAEPHPSAVLGVRG